MNPFAAPLLDALRLDLAFIGCNGIHPVHGVTNLNLPDAEIKTRVMGRSKRTIVIADATKLGRADLALIAPLAAVDTLVTAGAGRGAPWSPSSPSRTSGTASGTVSGSETTLAEALEATGLRIIHADRLAS